VADTFRRTLEVPGITLDMTEDVTGRLREKWAFITPAGVVTCLFRGALGEIIAAWGDEQILRAIAGGESIAEASGHPVARGARPAARLHAAAAAHPPPAGEQPVQTARG